MPGSPDWQQITEWFGPIQESATAFAIGAGSKVIGPFDLSTYSSVIVAVKPTGGTITGTITQSIPSGPASLTDVTTFTVAAGAVAYEAVVLLAGQVTVTLQGSAGGETVDYAVVPANTNVNTHVTGGSTVLNIVPTPLASWPPSSPVNGDLQVLELPSAYDPIGGKIIRWLCSYDSSNAMWDVVLGAPLYAEVTTGESISSAAYVALATAGPSVALPRAGDYLVDPGGILGVGVVAATRTSYMGYDIGGTGAVDANAHYGQVDGTIGLGITGSRPREKAGLTAVTLTAKYRTSSAAGGATVTAESRSLRVTPLRIA